jgi:hypothetical protein
MAINLTSSPYFDDYQESKKYHKILFVPDRPVQARELTQIQTIIQNQIKRLGDFTFQNGTVVIPGKIDFDNLVTYIKLEPLYNGVSIDNYIADFIDKPISNTNGVRAIVVHAEPSDNTDPPVLFIKYISGGIDANGVYYTTFDQSEVLTLETTTTSVQVAPSSYTGKGSLAYMTAGVYYMNGYFIQVSKQSLALDKFSSTPSYQIGLEYTESIATAIEDNTLYNNAEGFYNETSLGADRLKIELKLAKYDYFSTQPETQFATLLSLKDGEVQYIQKNTKLARVGDILAQRTQNESGDYIVTKFNYKLLPYHSNNRNEWTENTSYAKDDIIQYNGKYATALNSGISSFTYPSADYGTFQDGDITWLVVTDPVFNGGLNISPDNTNVSVLKINAGKCYIQGYEIDLTEGYKTVNLNKNVAHSDLTTELIKPQQGQYFIIDNIYGIPNISGFQQANIKNNKSEIVGTCRIRNMSWHDGSFGTTSLKCKLFIFDLKMNGSNTFARDAQKISGSGFNANIVGVNSLLSGNVSTTGSNDAVYGNGTLFELELALNDTVIIGNKEYQVDGISNSVELSVSPTITTINTSVPIYKKTSTLYGDNSLLQLMSHSAIKSVSQYATYYVNRLFEIQSIDGSITLSVFNANEVFADPSSELHIVSSVSGSALTVSPDISLTGLNNSQLRITKLVAGTVYRILTTIRKKNYSYKKKTRKFTTIKLNRLVDVDKAIISLNEADISKIINITQSGGDPFDFDKRTDVVDYQVLGETDITNYYQLNTGTTDTYYAMGTLTALGGYIPSAPIKITFEYFDHATSGDYFCVSSYDADVNFDYLDFRSRMSDSGLDFTSAGSSISEPLSAIYDIELSYDYYLQRRDCIELDNKGNFRIEEGVPSLQPVAPLPNEDHVIVAYIDHYANGDTKITEVPMKRYTMKDISKIDDRLTATEYYSSLDTIQGKFNSDSITDEFGFSRYKCGFLTDVFSTHLGSITNGDYKCSIDQQELECRPAFSVSDVKLIEYGNNRVSEFYQITGDLVTLPYTEEVLMENISASNPEGITPTSSVLGTAIGGVLSVYPSYDSWIDTETEPNITQTSEGSYNSIVTVGKQLNIIKTVWNSWQETARTNISTNTNVITNVSVTSGSRT